MVNVATSQITQPTRIVSNIVGNEDIQPHLLIAHRMIEAYLGVDKPLSLVTASYTITDSSQPLAAVDGYPINVLNDTLDGSTNQSIVTTYDDKHIWVAGTWPTTVVAQYVGGIESQIYNAIFRQAEVLQKRKNVAPELDNKEIGNALRYSWNPQYRSGLAPDIKQMVFPFKSIGF